MTIRITRKVRKNKTNTLGISMCVFFTTTRYFYRSTTSTHQVSVSMHLCETSSVVTNYDTTPQKKRVRRFGHAPPHALNTKSGTCTSTPTHRTTCKQKKNTKKSKRKRNAEGEGKRCPGKQTTCKTNKTAQTATKPKEKE